MTAAHVGEKVCDPVVIIKVNRVKCRALLDTGATGSYISAFLVSLLKVKPSRTLTRIKAIMGLVTKRVETYDARICDTLEKCALPVCVTKIEQRELLTLENPNYPEMLGRYPHLKFATMIKFGNFCLISYFESICKSNLPCQVWSPNMIWKCVYLHGNFRKCLAAIIRFKK